MALPALAGLGTLFGFGGLADVTVQFCLYQSLRRPQSMTLNQSRACEDLVRGWLIQTLLTQVLYQRRKRSTADLLAKVLQHLSIEVSKWLLAC